MAGNKRCDTMVEQIQSGETGELVRRSFLRSAMVFVSALSCMPMPAAQDSRHGSVLPPEPGEFDMVRLPKSANRPGPDLRGRSHEFSGCVK
jgi:hypothetical protein